jgi:hypothetical protein
MKEKLPSLLLALAVLSAMTGRAQEVAGNRTAEVGIPSGSVAGPFPQPSTLNAQLSPDRRSPDQLLSEAIAQLDGHSSIAARVRHRTLWFGQRLIGSGRYLQGPPGQRLMRLEVRTPLVDKVSTLQHVCDGQTLWIYEYSNAGKRLGRVDVEQAVQAFHAAPAAAGTPSKLLAVGGLPQLLRNLESSFEFTLVERRLLGDLPSWVLRGSWEKEQLARLLSDQPAEIGTGKQPDYAALAPQLPDEVVLWLGRDDLFPYRIEFRRTAAAEFLQKRNGLVDDRESSMIFEFFEVQFDTVIDPKEFTYHPGTLFAEDRTAGFMKRLGL